MQINDSNSENGKNTDDLGVHRGFYATYRIFRSSQITGIDVILGFESHNGHEDLNILHPYRAPTSLHCRQTVTAKGTTLTINLQTSTRLPDERQQLKCNDKV